MMEHEAVDAHLCWPHQSNIAIRAGITNTSPKSPKSSKSSFQPVIEQNQELDLSEELSESIIVAEPIVTRFASTSHSGWKASDILRELQLAQSFTFLQKERSRYVETMIRAREHPKCANLSLFPGPEKNFGL